MTCWPNDHDYGDMDRDTVVSEVVAVWLVLVVVYAIGFAIGLVLRWLRA